MAEEQRSKTRKNKEGKTVKMVAEICLKTKFLPQVHEIVITFDLGPIAKKKRRLTCERDELAVKRGLLRVHGK